MGIRRVVKWVALGALAILVVLTGVLLSLPFLLDADSVKAAALQRLSHATGGQWRVEHLRLDWLPAPNVSVEGATFSIPGALEGKVQRLSLTTALVPLLWGDVRLRQVALIAPDVTIPITSASAAAPSAPSGTFTVSDLRAALASVSKLKAVDLRSLELTIERGHLVLAVSNQPLLSFNQIGARASERSGRLEVDAVSASDSSQRLEAKIALDLERFDGNIELNATGVDLTTVLALAGVTGDPLQGLVNVRARVKVDGSPALRGTFDASSQAMSIASGGGKLAIDDLVTAGEAEWTDAGLRIAAREIHAAAPAVQAAAVLTLSPDWNRQRLEVKMQPTDIETVKQLVLPWTTDAPAVERYARMITAGQLSGLEATLQLDQIEHWETAIEARGVLSGVAMTLAQPNVPIRDLSATVALAQGKLTAQGVEASAGSSALHDGQATLDFTSARTGISASAQWQANLAQALALTKQQLAPADREKLKVLRALTGEARGRISMNGTFEQLHMLAGLDTVRAQASLEPLPWPINVTGATARFDGSELSVQGLTGSFGQSRFSQCNGRITLAAGSKLEISGCNADAALVELFDWGSKQFETPKAAKGLRVLAGRGLLEVHKIAGPLANPSKWSADVSVIPKTLRLSYPDLPGVLVLDGGSVRGGLDGLVADGVQANMLDVSLSVRGRVSGLRKGTPHLDLRAAGPVGEKMLAWGWERAGLKGAVTPIVPFEARSVRLRWPVGDGFETEGDLLFAGKTSVGFDALIEPGVLSVRKLDIRDEASDMHIAVRRQRDVVEGSIAGTLAGTSLDRIVRAKQPPQTRVAGDLTFRVPLSRPRDFSANGRLRIEHLTTLGWIGLPSHITFRTADFKAAGRSVSLAASFLMKDMDFDVNGTVRATDQRYVLDLDVKSDRVDVRRLLAGRHLHAPAESRAHPASWNFPVEGKVRLAIKYAHVEPYDIEPLLAVLNIAPGHIDFSVQQARVCGVGLSGGGRAQPETLSVDVTLRARDLDAGPALLCLTKKRTIVTGRLDADAHVTATGSYGELAEHFKGPFHLLAHDGRVDQLTGLAKILDFVNASELLRGKKLGLQSSGFGYTRFEVQGEVDGGLIHLDQAVLDAEPFDVVAHGSADWVHGTVDANVAVAPVQVLNAIVKLMPFLGYILGGGVYAVPVAVRGKLSDPEVVPVAPSAVASNVLGMLERTLKTPFNLRQALIPQAFQGNNAAAPAPAPVPAPSAAPR